MGDNINFKRSLTMKHNMGTVDRTIRTVIALIVGVLYTTDIISGDLAIILGVVAVIFLLTSIISICPLYIPFKISTRKKV